MTDQTLEERVADLEAKVFLLLQVNNKLIDDLTEVARFSRGTRVGLNSFIVRVMKEIPGLKEDFEDWLDKKHADNVGQADQVKAKLRDLLATEGGVRDDPTT